jgi:uncharacterized membrane protein
MLFAVTTFQVAVALHIMAVVVTFGAVFAYPLIFAAGRRRDPRAAPGMHGVQLMIWQRIVQPGIGVVLLLGLYLANKLSAFSSFYVGWGIGVIVVVGALGGAFFTPQEKRLSELARRDVAAAGDGEVRLSDEYEAAARRVAMVSALTGLLILVTILFMTLQTGS